MMLHVDSVRRIFMLLIWLESADYLSTLFFQYIIKWSFLNEFSAIEIHKYIAYLIILIAFLTVIIKELQLEMVC